MNTTLPGDYPYAQAVNPNWLSSMHTHTHQHEAEKPIEISPYAEGWVMVSKCLNCAMPIWARNNSPVEAPPVTKRSCRCFK